MTHLVDRNLAVGIAVALALAALAVLGVRAVPIHIFQAPAVAPETRAGAAWAEPREVDWRPRAAPKAPETATAALPVAVVPATAPSRAHARAADAPVATGLPSVAAPGGEVAVAPGALLGTAAPVSAAAGAGGGGAAPASPTSNGEGEAIWGPGDVDVPPQPLATPQPAFPSAAEKLGLSADVVLTLVIELDGRVSHVDTHCVGCDASFLRSTRETARTWRFVPARLHGQPVRVRVEQRIHFDLDD